MGRENPKKIKIKQGFLLQTIHNKNFLSNPEELNQTSHCPHRQHPYFRDQLQPSR